MLGNDTTILNSTIVTNSSKPEVLALNSPSFWVGITVLVLSTTTLIIGLLSWIIIKKFRHYKNYVFLNVILNNILNIMLAILLKYADKGTKIEQYVIKISYVYLKLSLNYWLLVMCVVFYVDLVKVLGGEVNRKYLKSSLFAWGLPLIITLWNVFVMPKIYNSPQTSTGIVFAALFLPLVINLLIYIKVLYIFLKTNVHSRRDRCQRVQVTTAIFFISGTLMLLFAIRLLKVKFPDVISIVLFHLQPVAMNLYFFIVRMNRKVWRQYYEKRLKKERLKLPCR